MWIADKWKDFEVLDCGNGEKVERWGKQVLVRPDPQAIWPKQKTFLLGEPQMRLIIARPPAAASGTSKSCRLSGTFIIANSRFTSSR